MSSVHEINGMSEENFIKLSSFVESRLGIKMPSSKKIMLESRLQKRLRVTNMSSYDEYINMVLGGNDEELVNMIDVITTNKTDFFREPDHFDYLTKTILPSFIAKNKGYRQYSFWSAGCATGEEPYTLAMVLQEFKSKHINFDYNIIASDISTRALKTGFSAVYDSEKILPVPEEYMKKYCLKSKDPNKNEIRIKRELRDKVSFVRLNFMDETFPFDGMFDVIFCRNVIIYFDRETQESLIGRMCRYLQSGGYFLLGHSETLTGMDLPLCNIGPTIYSRM